MVGSDLITIVIVLGIGYWLYSTGQLEKIFGSFSQLGANAGADGTDGVSVQGSEQHYSGPEGEAEVSGENAGAMVNGKCVGDPAQCAKAQNLLEQIM